MTHENGYSGACPGCVVSLSLFPQHAKEAYFKVAKSALLKSPSAGCRQGWLLLRPLLASPSCVSTWSFFLITSAETPVTSGFGLTQWPHFNVIPFIKTLPPNTVTFWGTRVRTSTHESGAGADTLQPITVYLLGIQGADHIKAGTKNFAFHVGTWHLLLGGNTVTNLDSILKSRDITLPTKVHIVKAVVFPVVMYGCESWTIKKTRC